MPFSHNHTVDNHHLEDCLRCQLDELAPAMAETLIDVSVYLVQRTSPEVYQNADHLLEMVGKISKLMQEKVSKGKRPGASTSYVPQPLDSDLVDKIIARNLPLAVIRDYPTSCIDFARKIEIEVHKKIKEQLCVS